MTTSKKKKTVCKPSEKACLPNSLTFTKGKTKPVSPAARVKVMREKWAVWEAYLALVSAGSPSLRWDTDADLDSTRRVLAGLHRIAVIVAERSP